MSIKLFVMGFDPPSGETSYEDFTATFTIRDTNENTSGMYTCKATNDAGWAEVSAQIIIQGTS